jgi:hypothetical protein
MEGGGRDVLRSVWNGIFFGRKGGAKGICVGWELCMHVSFSFFLFFLGLDDVRVLRCMEGGLVCCSLWLLVRNGEGDGVR